ncbi:DM13 domain-containing protein [Sulfidibacter corallicola]|uniref:DM13 domain-containing protein n=1 Tax=Sulfidibacter corallicola TaxID=2818388 RepID=A0A8A4TMB1_SULCO|nr:DM13 domain-containing protein [Sulfidibacter corallicola]QTD50252.1 DM13 domain-containing protein [Sulfidibacter corallicola]
MFRFSTWLCLSLLTSPLWAQTRMVPHVTPSAGDFKTELLLVNPSTTEQILDLMLFTADGTPLEPTSRTLAAGATQVLTPEDLAPGEVLSHFLVTNDSDIEITVSYQDAQGNNSAAHVETSTRQAVRWRIYPATLGDALDGLAIVNMDDQNRDIQVRQVGYDGVEIARATIANLNSKAKGLYLFNDFTTRAETWYEVFSPGPLALTALRFSTAGEGARFFWATAAVPLPALVENENQPPTITGQVDLSITAGTSLTLTLDQLTIEDPDNAPEDWVLMVADGTNYTRDGNTITPVDGFVGMLDVPVTCSDGISQSDSYLVQVTVTAAEDPRIGTVATLRNSATYGISGRAVIVDERTIRLENFSYNGGGPDVRVYLGLNNDFVNGPIISDSLSGTVFNNETLELTIPESVSLDDFNAISIWCTLFSISFSEGTFQ